MKKLALIIAFLMILPGAAFGLEMLNDSAMDDVTGQSGVSIAFDDVQIFMNIDKMYWQDNDGFASGDGYGTSAGATGGQIAINDFQLDVMRVNAITGTGATNTFSSTGEAWTDTTDGLYYDYSGDLADYETTTPQFRALTIDATKELPAISEGKANNTGVSTFDVGGVLIGLPTMEINIPNLQLTPVFYDHENDHTAGDDTAVNDYDYSTVISASIYGADMATTATYGTIDMKDITVTTLSGWLEIAPH